MFFGNYYVHTTYGSMVELLSTRGRQWSGTAAHHYAPGGTVVDPKVVDTTNGTTIGQDTLRTFSSVDSEKNWELVRVSGTQRFTMNVSRDSLVSFSSTTGLSALSTNYAFDVSTESANGSVDIPFIDNDESLVLVTQTASRKPTTHGPRTSTR